MSGMVAYWRLEESSGNRIDQHINHLDLTPSNSPGNGAGAVVTNGAANAYVSTATNMTLDGGTDSRLAVTGDSTLPVTYAFWLKINNVAGSNETFVFARGKLSVAYDFGLYLPTGNPFWIFTTGIGAFTTQWNTDLNWHFFVMSWNGLNTGGKFNLYKDNGALDQANGSPPSNGISATDPAVTFRLGGLYNQTTFGPNMSLDEFGIWRRILTVSERDYLWNNGAGRTYPFTATYPFAASLNGTSTRPRPFAPGLAR